MREAQAFPMLTTKRLELRAVQPGDGGFYHQLLSFAEVTRFSDLPDRATTAQADRFVDWMSKLFSSGRGCAWMIRERSTGRPLGAIRINRIHKPMAMG
jgi:ribosomal-protein-alanine N-acetyltransferase